MKKTRDLTPRGYYRLVMKRSFSSGIERRIPTMAFIDHKNICYKLKLWLFEEPRTRKLGEWGWRMQEFI